MHSQTKSTQALALRKEAPLAKRSSTIRFSGRHYAVDGRRVESFVAEEATFFDDMIVVKTILSSGKMHDTAKDVGNICRLATIYCQSLRQAHSEGMWIPGTREKAKWVVCTPGAIWSLL